VNAGHTLLERILLDDGDDPALVDALDRLSGEIPTEDLDLVGALLAAHGGNRADERGLAGGVERGHVGIGRHQIFRGGQGDILDILAIDRIEELYARRSLSRRLESIQALVLDEGIERANDADLGRAAHL